MCSYKTANQSLEVMQTIALLSYRKQGIPFNIPIKFEECMRDPVLSHRIDFRSFLNSVGVPHIIHKGRLEAICSVGALVPKGLKLDFSKLVIEIMSRNISMHMPEH